MFDNQWFEKHQSSLLTFANTALGRNILCLNHSQVGKNKIIEIYPNAIVWEDNENLVAEFRTHNKYSKRLYYGLKPFWHLIHAWDMNFANTLYPVWNLGFDTLITNPIGGANSPVDGHTDRQGVDEAFSDLISRAGNDHDVNASFITMRLTTGPTGFSSLFRGGFCFDTSKLSRQSKISTVTLGLYGDSKSNSCGVPQLDICDFNPASFSDLANSDYANFGSTNFASIDYNSFALAGYTTVNLSAAGILNVNRAGISAFGARLDWDLISNSTGFTRTNNGDFSGFMVKSADQTGTAQDPVLTITYKRLGLFATDLTTTSTSSTTSTTTTSTSTTTTSTTSSTTSTSTTTTSTSTTTTSTTTTSSSTTTTSSSTTTTSSSTTTTSTTTTVPYSISVDVGN